ncbi:SigE family RNA polymerase sigma factor [soil metagenome]
MRKREQDAEFSQFVKAASPELLRTAWFLTGDVERAKELVQASLVKTYLAWSRVRPAQAMPFTRRVMANHRTDGWRKHRREVLVDPHEQEAQGHGDQAEDVVTTTALVDALRRLPEQQRRVVVLRYYCDLSERVVAAELGISVGAVKSTAARGLSALRGHYSTTEEWAR